MQQMKNGFSIIKSFHYVFKKSGQAKANRFTTDFPLRDKAHTASDQLSTQAQQLLQDIENDTQAASPQKQKMPKAAALGFCLMMYAAQLFAADSSQQMQQALSLYNNAQYTQAAVMYEAILKTEQQSAALYYNLGNCYF